VVADAVKFDLQALIQQAVFLPSATENFGHDLDGNLIQDGRWSYTYDAENRLVKMETLSDLPAEMKVKLVFTYDYMGRRIKKEVYNWDNQTNGYPYNPTETRKSLYDGWLLVAEIKDVGDVPCLDRALAWGPDLSGSLEGAGGIGGLVAQTQYGDNITTYLPAYDGNGNTVGMLRADNGTWAATYTYSPYGQTLTSTGSYAASNPFRFSTKYNDSETGLLYFGYRYYNDDIGRWITRDPVEENDNNNLYMYCRNRPVFRLDSLGTYSCNWTVIDLGNSKPAWEKRTIVGGSTSLTFFNYLISIDKCRGCWRANPKSLLGIVEYWYRSGPFQEKIKWHEMQHVQIYDGLKESVKGVFDRLPKGCMRYNKASCYYGAAKALISAAQDANNCYHALFDCMEYGETPELHRCTDAKNYCSQAFISTYAAENMWSECGLYR
jgi:RHS repeat-associated protein